MKKGICLFLSVVTLMSSSLNTFAASNELSFDEFFTTLQEEYAKYDIDMHVNKQNDSVVFTQELLAEELTKVPEIAAAFEKTEIIFTVESGEVTEHNSAISPRIMPVSRTLSFYGQATNVLLAGAFAEIKLDVYTTVDIGNDKFIAVNGHESYKDGYAVNFRGYSETGFSWSYANAQKTLNVTWSGNVSFATTVAGQEVSYDTKKTWNGSVNA